MRNSVISAAERHKHNKCTGVCRLVRGIPVGISHRVADLRDPCGLSEAPTRHRTASTPAFQMPVISPGVTRSYRDWSTRQRGDSAPAPCRIGMPDTCADGARRREQVIVSGHQEIRRGSATCLDRPAGVEKTAGE